MALRVSTVVPLVAFAALASAFAVGLTNDPKTIPSMLIDRQLPKFALPPLLDGVPGLASDKLQERKLVLINVFSSWCSGCRFEHPFLLEKSKDKRFLLVGLNWKDDPVNARAFIAKFGNPFEEVGSDEAGRVGIDLGVTGVPETFVLDSNGRVRLRVPGPMTPEVWKSEIEPLIAKESRS